MENFGKTLQDKRIEKGYTVEDISKITRLTIKHIKALENGDMNFFQDDLSYLRFFVKSYCDAVDYDYEIIKGQLQDDMTEYTNSFSQAAIKEHEEIERKIRNSDKLSAVPGKQNNSKKTNIFGLRGKRISKIDFSFASLIAIVVVVAIVIMFAFIIYINTNKPVVKEPVNEELPIADGNKKTENSYQTEEEETTKKNEEVKKEIEFTSTDLTHFNIENIKEGDPLIFDIQFVGSNSAFTFSVDGVALSEPASKIYNIGSSAQATLVAKKGMKIQIYFGWLLNDPIKINDKTVNIDPSIANSSNSYTFEFTVM